MENSCSRFWTSRFSVRVQFQVRFTVRGSGSRVRRSAPFRTSDRQVLITRRERHPRRGMGHLGSSSRTQPGSFRTSLTKTSSVHSPSSSDQGSENSSPTRLRRKRRPLRRGRTRCLSGAPHQMPGPVPGRDLLFVLVPGRYLGYVRIEWHSHHRGRYNLDTESDGPPERSAEIT